MKYGWTRTNIAASDDASELQCELQLMLVQLHDCHRSDDVTSLSHRHVMTVSHVNISSLSR